MELENITAGYTETIEGNFGHALEYVLITLAIGAFIGFVIWVIKHCK